MTDPHLWFAYGIGVYLVLGKRSVMSDAYAGGVIDGPLSAAGRKAEAGGGGVGLTISRPVPTRAQSQRAACAEIGVAGSNIGEAPAALWDSRSVIHLASRAIRSGGAKRYPWPISHPASRNFARVWGLSMPSATTFILKALTSQIDASTILIMSSSVSQPLTKD
jgi:hypothetical protein